MFRHDSRPPEGPRRGEENRTHRATLWATHVSLHVIGVCGIGTVSGFVKSQGFEH